MRSLFSNGLMNSLVSRRSEADQRLWAEEVMGLDTAALPRRYFFESPRDNGSYVLPLKQSFIKDARLMPGTRLMLALLAGWAGTGRPLDLTQATIANHLRRSVRQVFRYLQDAMRAGYLRQAYTKNTMGLITGLKIYLAFPLLRPDLKRKPRANPAIPARTHASDTNTVIKDSYPHDPELAERLDRMRRAAGFAAD